MDRIKEAENVAHWVFTLIFRYALAISAGDAVDGMSSHE